MQPAITSGRLVTTIEALRYPKTPADWRHRKIALAAVSSAVSRVTGLLLVYVSVSLAVGKLGAVAFGLWMTINGMAALLPFADLGLGNGLVSYVSLRIGESEVKLIPNAAAACFYMASGVGLILGAGGALLCHSALIRILFRHQDSASLLQIAPAATAFFVCFGLTLPLSVVEKFQMGAQDSYISNLWQLFTNLLACLSLYLVFLGNCQLYNLVLVYSGIPVITKAANFVFYSIRRPELAPAFRNPDWGVGRRLLKCGASFVVLQSSVALAYTCDNLILASQLGALAVAEYDVTQRLFSITVLAELSIVPLWAAFGEALGRGDVAWARKTFHRSILANGALAALLSAILLISAPTLIPFWTHGRVHPGWALLAAFAVWKVFITLQTNLSALLNHERTLNYQTVFFLFAAIVSFGLKFPLLHAVGPGGLVIATVISLTFIYAIPCLRLASKLLSPQASAPALTEVPV